MITKNKIITLSIVSHLQQDLVKALLDDLEKFCSDDVNVILTLNKQETLAYSLDDYSFPIHVIKNTNPKGFGANHNYAFNFCNSLYYCVINPDIRLSSNPFLILISEINQYDAALIAPMVCSPDGYIEDSVRKFPTPISILKKMVNKNILPDYSVSKVIVNPDWVGGMFMLFKTDEFKSIGGFDEKYFLYYEDVDICMSLHGSGNSIVYSPSTSVIHAARRSSHKNIRYLKWHVKSMLRFFTKSALKYIFWAKQK